MMKPARTLLYFGHVPFEGAGSAIIVLRHLRRFASEGWKVRVVADWGQDHTICSEAGWPVFELPHRLKWWPPYNVDHPLSRRLRAWLWAGCVRAWEKKLPSPTPAADAVLTYLSAFSDTLSHVALAYARRHRRPLATLIHDDCRCFTSPAAGVLAHRRRQHLVEVSTRAWFASPELAACYELPPGIAGTLPPIPEGFAASPTPSAPLESPLIAYAGNYWEPQLPTLMLLGKAARSAGGRFLAVLNKGKPDHLAGLAAAGVECRSPFPRNTEALDYYRRHAAAMVVSYAPSSDAMPWTRTSFPSKLIEYCHLGLPIVIVASEDTAVARWARACSYPDIYAPDDTAGITAYIARLRDPLFRATRAAIALDLAREEFNPDRIQAALAESLTRSDE